MNNPTFKRFPAGWLAIFLTTGLLIWSTLTPAQKNIALNPSNQTGNAVCGGSNEAYYALIMANLAKDKLTALGYSARVFEGDISGIPAQVNTWNLQSGGAHAFVSMHTNATAAGGCAGTSRGTTTYYHPNFKQSDVLLAGKVQSSLTNCLDIKDNGFTVHWLDLAVLRGQIAPACLEEALFHDNSTDAGILRSADGQERIANGVSNGIHRYFGGTGNPCGGAAPPGNDEPCTADTLRVQTACNYSTSTLVKASKSAQISDASCDQPSNVDVWFKFSIPKGNFSIHTNSLTIAGNDCGMAIYTGNCNNLNEVACLNGGNPSQKYMPWSDNLNLSSYAGQTGYIRLWEFGSVSNTGDFQICITGTANNLCSLTSVDPPTITLGPEAFSSGTGKNTVTINGQPNCSYSVSGGCDWLTFNSPGGLLNNSGQALLDYSATANNNPASRNCTVSLNGLSLLITQNGCTLPDAAAGIIVVSGTNPACTGQTITYSVPVIPNAASYAWLLPDGTSRSTATNTVSVFYTGALLMANLRVKGVNGCGNGPESVLQVSVNNPPPAPVISLSNGVLTSSVPNGNQWYQEDKPVQNAVNQAFVPKEGGKYHSVIITGNCTSPPSNEITVTTGIDDLPDNTGIRVYPNPTTGQVEVSIEDQLKSDFRVEVYNQSGAMILLFLKQMDEKLFRIDLDRFMAGIYILRISNPEFHFSCKLIKK